MRVAGKWAAGFLILVNLRAAPFALSEAHLQAAARPRRIVVQLDAADHRRVHCTPEEWLKYIFGYVDQPGSQIDTILLDIGLDSDSAVYPSKVLPPTPDRWITAWRGQGFEWVGALVQECHRRHLEVLWNHRFSEVDLNADGGLEMSRLHSIKAAHPDWLIRSWWWQGLWNAAAPGVREMKVRILRELVEEYPLDGIQIDFARHVPALPVGHQWEQREGPTVFLRELRGMLLEAEKKRERPLLLSVKVPRTVEGARADGFDVATWSREKLVDMMTLGSRSMDVDLEGYRRVVGAEIKLMPCFDDHHATDGYRFGSMEFLRGVFNLWWSEGADAVTTFNWAVAPPEWAARVGDSAAPATHGEAYLEIGSMAAMRRRNRLFAVERRGGYPWAEGFFNRNESAPLPYVLANDGRTARFSLRIADTAADLSSAAATLRLVLFRAGTGDHLQVTLNQTPLSLAHADPAWKDPQIFSPDPQPASGGTSTYRENPKQKLLLLLYPIPPAAIRHGRNELQIGVKERGAFPPASDIQIEKIEAAVTYAGVER